MLKDFWVKNKVSAVWAITLAVIFFWVFGAEVLNVRLPFTEFMNRSWHSFKLGKQKKFFKEQYRASNKVKLLQLEYSNRVDFWFDTKTKAALAAFLKSYPDPVIINMDPVHLLKDAALKKILSNPNIIRPFRVETVAPGADNFEVEKLAGFSIEQYESATSNSADCLSAGDISKCFSVSQKILPDDAKYFESGYLWAFPALGKSLSRTAYDGPATINDIADIPLSLKGSRLEVPTPVLPAVALSKGCHGYRLSKDFSLSFSDCKSGEQASIQLQNPLPLYFYNKAEFKRVSLAASKNISGTLIVDVVDSASYFANLHGEKYSFGELMATALSNVLRGHTPQRSANVAWAEKVLFLLALTILLLYYRRAVLNTFTEVLTGGVLLLLLIDFASAVFLNLRTEPMTEIFAFCLAGILGFTILSQREYKRRSLIEKALSGYVSPDRLRNLVSGKEKLELSGKRKELTTILLDIAGFGLIAKELEIGNVFGFIQKFFGAIDPIIFKNRGVIDKKTGDGLLAFCGDSDDMSPKDAALAAVKTAYEIQSQLGKLTAEFFGVNHNVEARIGVNTGEMMVGNAGSEKHFNYTVLGDAVNFTERLESACPAGGVLIGERTAGYVKDHWKLELMQIMIKHEEKPVSAYKVLGPV